MNLNEKFKNFIFILPIILISFYYSIYQFEGQSAVDGGLVLSGLVDFPNNFSNVKSIFYNGWTILHHLTLILFKINFSVDLISTILIFIITIFYTLGIYFLILGFNHSKMFALIMSLIVIISRENFGEVDYPVLFFSEHTYGAFSLSTFTLVAGLLSNKNYKSAGLFSAVLFGSHLVVGVWVILLIVASYITLSFLNKEFNNSDFKKILIGIIFISIPLITSFIYFQSNLINKPIYEISDLNIYLNQWDHHRNISIIHYGYLIKTFVLIFLLTIYIFYCNNHKKSIFYLFIIFSCLGSMMIYLLIKFFPDLFPQIIIRAMPTRLFLLHSVIGYPIIISILYFFIKKKYNLLSRFNINLKYFSLIGSALLLIILIFNFDKIASRFTYVKQVLLNGYYPEEKVFWQKVNKIESDGYFITSFNSSGPTLRYGKKPYLINVAYFDHIPYHPYTVSETKLIIEKIYGISFFKPPSKYVGALIDDWYEEFFIKKNYEDWLNLSKKYNISGIIVPSNWDLQIKDKITSKKFTAYIIN